MTGPDLGKRQRAAPKVDYRMFLACDPYQREGPLGPDVPVDDEILRAGPNGVLFLSGRNHFRPDVTVEVWRAEPPPDRGEWDEDAETAFEAPSATLVLARRWSGSV